ncbi:SDR family NAD(P)-dependent oxidoreductase [Sphaerisporangium sp. B11E5]|uniref:SDR family NAD(P)-dependent oxidoreductase n=1 Tax=Sphaerisporangium sp. B11E5 TaxID=3153563 RepID=UPI00325C633D
MPAIESQTLLTHSDFIMRNHRVHGVSVMPGVVFFDIVYRTLAAAGWDPGRAVLREVLFTEAVATKEDADRELRVTVGEPRGGEHEVEAESRWVRDGTPLSPWRRNLIGKLVLTDDPEPAPIDPPALKAAAGRVGDMEDLYARARAEDIRHGDAMKCAGRLHHGRGSLLAELRLAAPEPGHERFHLHPAALDASTIAGLGQTKASGEEPFIPVYVREFRAPRRLGQAFYVYARAPETLAPSGDVITNDYGLYDVRGRFVAGFTGLSCKRIRFPGLMEKLLVVESGEPGEPGTSQDGTRADGEPAAPKALVARLREMVAERLGRPSAEVPTDQGFYDLGLDSVTLVRLSEELERFVGQGLYPTLLFEYSDIDSLAAHLSETYEGLAEAGPVNAPAEAPRPSGRERTVAYREVWVPEPAQEDDDPGELVVIAGSADLPSGTVVRVEQAEDFEKTGDRAYRLDARDRGQTARLLADLAERGPRHFVLAATPGDDATDVCLKIWALAGAIIGTKPQHPVTLTFAHEGGPAGDAAGALARTISAETPVLRCRSVQAAAGDLAKALRDTSSEPAVRYENGARLVRRWVEHDLAEGAVPIRQGGVYVIAGGAGGIGGLLAGHLESHYDARPVVLSRSTGTDITKPDEVQRALAEARDRYGRIDGVVHCAGVQRDGLYFRQEPGDVEAVLAPKTRGVANLDAATEDDDLDFFLIFSSLAATLPNPGQSAYAYANAYLESFARWRDARPGRRGTTLAIGWPYWADGGMRIDAAALDRSRQATGLTPLPTADALTVLTRGLAGGGPGFVVLHGDEDRVSSLLPAPSEMEADERDEPDEDAIAVIGLAGRYPQAPDLDTFWRNLAEGRDCVTEVPADRWDHDAYYDPDQDRAGRTYGRWGGFLDGVDRFDRAFFGVSRRDAERMDPQERLFLQTCWHALEDAGYPPDALTGENVGVFAGVMWNHYQLVEGGEGGVAPLAMHASIANRVSYTFDFDGPSMALDTSCSSSLTAAHMAVESLRRGECTLALAGGVNVSVHPQKYLQLAQGRFLSPDGRCRAFGKDAGGYVPGEGVGAVLLKPLAAARRDGDHIYGVIRASAVNHTGRTSGATVPSPTSQAALIGTAVRRSGWDPATIGYIEAHGTGTSLGDPIEVEGLRKAFATSGGTCALGSVKSNIGHLEGAAGIAGLTKVLLQMKHHRLVPSLHAEEPNPHIDFAKTPFHVQHDLAPWPRPHGTPRRAGVSAFGAGGANAHILLEEHEQPPSRADRGGPHLFLLSARDDKALQEYAQAYVTFLDSASGPAEPPDAPAAHPEDVVERLADLLGVPADQIDTSETLGDLGLDATGLMRLPGASGLTLDSTVDDLIAPRPASGPAREHSGQSREHSGRDREHSGRDREHSGRDREHSGRDREHSGQESETGRPGGVSLADLAYTSQVGRTALPVRLALVVPDMATLRDRLAAFARGEDPGPGAYTGTARSEAPEEGPTPDECVRLFRDGRLGELAAHWTAGGRVPWRRCHPDEDAPRRVSLPTYPFQEERCWVGGWRGGRRDPGTPLVTAVPEDTPADAVRANSPAVPEMEPAVSFAPEQEDVRSGDREDARAGEHEDVRSGEHEDAGSGEHEDARSGEPEHVRSWEHEGVRPQEQEDLRFAVRDGVAVVTMNSGPNMFTDGLIAGLQDAFAQIAARDDVKAVVVTGAGKVFSMGGTPEALRTLSEGQGRFTDVPFLYEGMLKCDRPVIAAIQGHASGGGLAYGLYADVVLMAREGVYSANFMKFGFTPGMGATYVLEERFGRSLAHEMLFTGRPVGGDELERRGANVTILPQRDVLKIALRHARSIAALPLPALRALKTELAGRVLGRLTDVIASEVDLHERVLGQESASRVQTHLDKIDGYRGRPTSPRPTPSAPAAASAPAPAPAQAAAPAPAPAAASAPAQAPASAAEQAAAPDPASAAAPDPASAAAPDPASAAAPAPAVAAAEPAPDSATAVPGTGPVAAPAASPSPTGSEVREVVMTTLSAHLYLEADEIDESQSFSEMGLDSIGAVEIVRDLNRRFQLDLDSVAVYDHPTIPALVDFVLTTAADQDAPVAAQADATTQVPPEDVPTEKVLTENIPVDHPVDAGPAAAAEAVPSPPLTEAGQIRLGEPGTAAVPSASSGPEYVRVDLRPIGKTTTGTTAPAPAEPASAPSAAAAAAPASAPSAPAASAQAPAPAPAVASSAPAEAPAPESTPDIAVIGMAGRFPDAPDLAAFWENLAVGRCSIREVPAGRFDVSAVYDPDRKTPGTTYSKWGAMLSDVDAFDAGFFNVSPLEAEAMDPQQRLFLEEAWHALEDAGYAARTGERRPWGTFVGCAAGDYARLLAAAGDGNSGHAFLGNVSSVLPARIAYLLNFSGPTMAVDTACSSSLVAVHLACESIRRGECQAAVAGGVAVMTTAQMHIWCSSAGMLSPTGRCAPFDASADGIVLGEGVGAVVLKRLDQALADGDTVRAVIRGSGTNGDGATNGITAPSAASQAELLTAVHRRAGVRPEDIDYVEAHGTGTALGDPIEAKALTQVFGTDGGPARGGLGSLKANVGHTTTAAGIGGLLKVLLALGHRRLPPSPGYTTANPKIDMDRFPLKVVTELSDWRPGPSGRRTAAVSSFGFSGTNCHVVVSEPDDTPPRREAAPAEVVVPVSATTEQALDRRLRDLAAHLAAHPDLDVRDVAYTLAVGRPHLPVRTAVTARDVAGLVAALSAPAEAGGASAEIVRRYRAGEDVDWAGLYGDRPGRRVPLPVYPFARDRHWVEAPRRTGDKETDARPTAAPALDQDSVPVEAATTGLVREDVPAGTAAPGLVRDDVPVEAAASGLVRPDDWIVADHRIMGTPVLPGVASLVMAADRSGLPLPLRFSGVRWLRPYEITEPRRVCFSSAEEDGRTRFTLEDGAVPYAKGAVAPGAGDPEPLDLAAIAARCPRTRDAGELYAAFDRAGLHYGPAFQVLRELRAGQDEALAELSAPPRRWDTEAPQPALLDGALQVIAALRTEDATAPAVPFAVESVDLVRPLAGPGRAYARRDGEDRYSVWLADEQGRVCAWFSGVTLRTRQDQQMIFVPVWREAEQLTEPPEGGRALVLHTAADEPVARAVLALHGDGRAAPLGETPDLTSTPYDTVYVLARTGDPQSPPEDDPTTLAVFRLLKRLIDAGYGRRALTLKVVVAGALPVADGEPVVPHAAGLIGLTRSAGAEYLRWKTCCVDAGAVPSDPEDLARRLRAEDCAEPLVALREHRLVRVLEPHPPGEGRPEVFRHEGAYLIVGGTGGIGQVLARHLARTVRARLALVGRTPATEAVTRQIAEIESLGGQAVYLRADVSDRNAFREAVTAAADRLGPLNGAFHAALVLRDTTLADMDEASFSEVLAAKVAGSVSFAEALRDQPVDFLTFFSSAASFVDAGGQANYAAASTFEDAYALSLGAEGHQAVVVNWGFWGSVGAVAREGYADRFANLGIGSIEPQEGLTSLARVLQDGPRQAVIVKGTARGLARMGVRRDAGTGRDAHAVRVGQTERTGPREGTRPEESELARAREAFAALDELARDLVFRTLATVLPAPGERTAVSDLRRELRVREDRGRLFDAVLHMLASCGLIRVEDGTVRTAGPPAGPSPDGTLARFPDMEPHVRLLTTCVAALTDVLAGDRDPMEVLFPGGRVELVEQVYRGQSASDYFNRLLAGEAAEAVRRAYAEHRRPVRLLEAGAGTGAATAFVLPAVAGTGVPVEYAYTDISPAFLRHGEETFGERYPFVSYALFDVEHEPAGQGFPAGTHDVVLATNVLHATADIRQTLRNAATLLGPGGVLLVNEVTRAADFLTLTFGLTSGWWRFTDPGRRLPHAPLLGATQWHDALRSAGLAPARTHGIPGTPVEDLDQCVLVGARQEAATSGSPDSPDSLDKPVRAYIKQVFAEVLKYQNTDFGERLTFDNFGVDSLVTQNIIQRFERDLGTLPATLLFENLTIDELAKHFLAEYEDRLRPLLQPAGPTPGPASGPAREVAGPAAEPAGEPSVEIVEVEDRTPVTEPLPEPSPEPAPVPSPDPVSAGGPGDTGPLDIAVIAVTGRYPRSPDLDTFWRNLVEGANCVTEVPEDRFRLNGLFDPKRGRKDRTYSRWGGFIDDVDRFDPAFFGILPRDAAAIDPQERLFLETAWTLLEDAGYLSEYTREPATGVFVGTMYGSYGRMAAAEGWPRGRYAGAHSAYWSIANRVSYVLDLRGPSFAVDSACSSSLTAIQLACESLRRGECAMAVAGGVNLILHPAHHVSLCSMNMLSGGDACKVFDEAADGFVPGEGVGAVLLKPLAKAVADGDRVHGVIKGAFANAGGRTSGYTVPNPNAQAELVAEAIRRSGVDPATISYVEAHGTGTSLGDPIEIASLTKAFRATGRAPQRCAVGSVKANIGHLEGAAGIAGLTKVLLQMRHGRVAPCANLATPNPKIDFAGSPFHPPVEAAEWTRPVVDVDGVPRTVPRRAGVSSFGAGGANAHIVVEEYMPSDTPGTPQSAAEEEVVLLSARTRDQLRALAGRVADLAEAEDAPPLRSLAYTSQVGRAELPERLAARATGLAELAGRLRAFAGTGRSDGVAAATAGTSSDDLDLLGDDDGASFVAALTERRQIAKLGRLWVKGVPVDWRPLWPSRPPRVTMPRYPFDRRRYWLPDATSTGQAEAGGPLDGRATEPAEEQPAGDRAAGDRAAREAARDQAGPPVTTSVDEDADTRCTYLRPVWERAPLEDQGPLPRAVLILGDDEEAGAALAATLKEAGTRCLRVTHGNTYAGDGNSRTLDLAGGPEDARRLAAELAERDELPEVVVQLLSAPFPGPDQDAVAEGLDRSFYPLLWTLTALLATPGGGPLRAVVAHTDDGTGPRPHHAALAAVLRTLALEHSRFSGVTVEVPGTGAEQPVLAELRAVPQEAAPEDRVTELRYRDGIRWRKGLEPFRPGPAGLRVRRGGTYLITGGAGAIGLAFAGHLAAHGPVNLVLTGRSPLDDDLRARVEALPATYVQADVRDARDVTRLVEDTRRRFGPVNGVIHAAGVHRDARAVHKERADADAVLGPKVLGTVLLDEALRGDPLDFLALFSSVAAETGNLGQVDYTYANAFLDRFAELREARGHGRTISVCWPLWEEGGMTVDDVTRRMFARRWGSVPMRTRAGLTAFARGVAGTETCLLVVEGAEETSREERPHVETTTNREPAHTGHDETVEIDHHEAVRADLRRIAAGFLLVDEDDVDLDGDLTDSGFDSISIAELVDKVNGMYGIDLLPTVLFEAANLSGFCDHLAENHRSEIEAAHRGDPVESRDEQPEAVVASQPVPRPQPVATPEPQGVAVIGMAGTLPGSPDLDTFWRHLVAGDDLVRPVPEDRAELRENAGTAGVRAGFLDDVRSFDAALFGISPKEATTMDPQQRLFLQTVWRAIEDAGYRPSELAGTATGLFAGVSACDYDDLLREHGVPVEAHTASGVASCILANRVSHVLDLRGPSEAIDTACSSSLVALHRAVRAIEGGECSAAIAGGVNLTLSPGLYIAFTESGMLSADGACKTFDERADGYARGEGCGAVLLKPLAAALADGDQVLAVVKGSAVNHGGRGTSLTAPNPEAQADVLVGAYRRAGVDPGTISYIEAHGTGTRLGDPIEIEGLKKAFGRLYDEWGRPAAAEPHVAVASVKTNIGHLEAAAGIAGLLKVLLCMRHGELPPTIHYERPNPYLRLDGTPFSINDRLRAWDGVPGESGVPVRRAGVSSFGFGGTNAHVVLEAYEPAERETRGGGPRLLVLSARTPAALDEYARRLARHLARHPEADLDEVAYTLQVGREAMAERLAVEAEDLQSAIVALTGGDGAPGVHRGSVRRGSGAARAVPTGRSELARAWVEGAEVAWEDLWGSARPRRVSLPSFPFERVEHWFTVPARSGEPTGPVGERPTAPVEERHTAPVEERHTAPVPERPTTPVVERREVSAVERPTAPVSERPEVPAAGRPEARARGVKVRLRPSSSRPAPVEREERASRLKLRGSPGRSSRTAAPITTPEAVQGGEPATAATGVEEMVRERLSGILGTDPAQVSADTPFAELGLDSIFRMELVKGINAAFSLNLQASELYEYDTVERLTRAVEEALGGRPAVELSSDAPAEPEDPVISETVITRPAAAVAPSLRAGEPSAPAGRPGRSGADGRSPAEGSEAKRPADVQPSADGVALPMGGVELSVEDFEPSAGDMESSAGGVGSSAGGVGASADVRDEVSVSRGDGSTEEQVARLVAGVVGRDVDAGRTFADNGLTSFEMLRVVSALEKQVGALRKTLLFDRPTVAELAAHLDAEYGAGVLRETEGARGVTGEAGDDGEEKDGEPLVIAKRRVGEKPGLLEVFSGIDREHAKEGGLAGRDIAPLAFLGGERKGYLNFSEKDGNLLAWSYVGSEEYFPRLIEEYVAYAGRHGFKPNFLSLIPVDEVAGRPYTATPFGAVQRLDDLGSFTLKGGRMERLRYMVRRFSKNAECRTVEHHPGADASVDREVAELVDRWGRGKQMVNPYVAVVRREIEGGSLDTRRHRMFLTYRDDVLTNAVIITKIPSENAYLLDAEFYPKDMPLGGLEYAITRIIELLVAEGVTMFSFGASFGVQMEENTPNAADDVTEALDELRSVGIFGEGNFQFKNKFRPVNVPIYLCQPAGPERTSVADVILMIADPHVAEDAEQAPEQPSEQAPEAEPARETPQAAGDDAVAARADLLKAHGYNPIRVPADRIETDLVTDSWAELDSPCIRRRMRDLTDRAADLPDATELPPIDWLPFPLVVPTGSGRSAETLLCRSWPGRRGTVLHNGLFPTWYLSLVDAGFEPVRVPGTEESGEIDIDALRAALREHRNVSFVCVEVSDNAAGGYPTSLANLREVKSTAAGHSAPLVIDGARVMENAIFVADENGRDEWDVVADIFRVADHATVSLSKDFGLTAGGLLATRDGAVAEAVRERVATLGRDAGLHDRKVIAAALGDRAAVSAQVRTRMEAVATLWQGLEDAGVPVVSPAGGHCVLLDVSRMEMFAGHDHPVMSCLAWMYRETGVRGGPHLGRDGCVRLAVPVGFGVVEAKDAAARIASAYHEAENGGAVPRLVADGALRGAAAAQAEYRPAEHVPEDVQRALREKHRPRNENLEVLREHNPEVAEHLVRTPDGDVEVFTAGSGPTLLLMHPFNIGAGVYAEQFASLAESYRLVSVHHPGVGRTTAAADITLDGIARLCHGVLEELGQPFPAHVAGWSFGGLTALSFALRYPQDTASLILIASSHRIGNRVGEINRLEVVAREDFDHVIAESGSERLRAERDRLVATLLRAESMDPQIGLRYLDVFADRPDLLGSLPDVSVPTLIVQGAHDTVIPGKTAHLLHGAIPDATYAEIPEAGHFPGLTSPGEVNTVIAEFLGGVS